LARDARAALTVAHIIELPADMPDIPGVDLTSYRRARFDQAHAMMRGVIASITPTVAVNELLLAGRAGPELIALIGAQQPDLVVMGLQGCSSSDPMSLGSVTEHVVRRAPCPVLTVPPATPAFQGA
jgi:nucleotide-binding universal stress UspA family protein